MNPFVSCLAILAVLMSEAMAAKLPAAPIVSIAISHAHPVVSQNWRLTEPPSGLVRFAPATDAAEVHDADRAETLPLLVAGGLAGLLGAACVRRWTRRADLA